MPRHSPPYSAINATFGPGPLTPAVKWLLIANVVVFVAQLVAPSLILLFGLRPADVLGQWRVWQPVTYMFLHAGVFHIGFNMLTLWMFGVQLESFWGTAFFARYYAICGVGAALVTVALSLLPFEFANQIYGSLTVGASGAIYGLLLAYGLYFPRNQILLFFLFPVSARVFVLITGAMVLYSALASTVGTGGGVAHFAHLGGLAVGWLYLRSGRLSVHPIAEIKYRYLKWKINRVRKKFDVYSGGRADDVNRRIH